MAHKSKKCRQHDQILNEAYSSLERPKLAQKRPKSCKLKKSRKAQVHPERLILPKNVEKEGNTMKTPEA